MQTEMRLSEIKQDRVLVATIHTNDVEFLRLQNELLKKHMKVPYDFAVGFDKPELKIHTLEKSGTEEQIFEFAKENHLTFIEIPKRVHHSRNDYF